MNLRSTIRTVGYKAFRIGVTALSDRFGLLNPENGLQQNKVNPKVPKQPFTNQITTVNLHIPLSNDFGKWAKRNSWELLDSNRVEFIDSIQKKEPSPRGRGSCNEKSSA